MEGRRGDDEPAQPRSEPDGKLTTPEPRRNLHIAEGGARAEVRLLVCAGAWVVPEFSWGVIGTAFGGALLPLSLFPWVIVLPVFLGIGLAVRAFLRRKRPDVLLKFALDEQGAYTDGFYVSCSVDRSSVTLGGVRYEVVGGLSELEVARLLALMASP